MKLVLQAVGNNWEKFKQRKRNKVFIDVRKKILERDQYRCQFCEFESVQLEVINLDNDYGNNKEKNLVSACSLCARCTLLDSYSIDYKGRDKIIYCPELTQEQLNQLVRVLIAHMYGEGTDEIYNAKATMAQLQDRSLWLDEKAGCHLSHPGLFSQYINFPNSNKGLVNRLRWLPEATEHEQEVEEWKAKLFS